MNKYEINEVLQRSGIDSKITTEGLNINGKAVIIINDHVAQTGPMKFRFKNIFEFVENLQTEGFDFSHSGKRRVKKSLNTLNNI